MQQQAFPQVGVSVLKVTDNPDSYFCCGGGYNESSELCSYTTHGTQAPFLLTNGLIVFNRSDASIGPNSTTTVIATATATATALAKSSSSRDAAIGAGVGVPLALLLLSALFLLWQQDKGKKALQRRLAEYETQHETQHVSGYSAVSGHDVKEFHESQEVANELPRQEVGGEPIAELAGPQRY